MNFTNAQKLACDISRNIAVTAGAGSGKTSVLVQRYIWCLENKQYNVRRIVAITFTEKAAGEMLGRIRERVLDYVNTGHGDPQRWEDVLEHLPLANISTIHSFCQKLLREFPRESGVDPQFEVLDEAAQTIVIRRLLDEFLRAEAAADSRDLGVLARLWKPAALREILHTLLTSRDKSLSWAERMAQETFPAYLSRIRELWNQAGRRGIRRLAEDAAWRGAIDAIRAILPPNDSSKLTGRCLNILQFDGEFRESDDPAAQIDMLGMLRRELSMIGVNKAWKEDGRDARLRRAFDTLKEAYAQHIQITPIHEPVERSGFEIQQALARVFLAARGLYCAEKSARRRLDFDDLEEGALKLLQRPDAQPLLAARYDYIMVDEFQDTNQTQWEIIRRLGATAQGLAKDKFCIVGDEKQSIYMFRGAEVAVFAQVRNALKTANAEHLLRDVAPTLPELGDPPVITAQDKSGELVMAENFRSDDAVIDFCNYVFSRLFLPSFDPERPYEVPHQELLARREEQVKILAPARPVELLLALESGESADANGEADDEPELVARRIRQLLVPAETPENPPNGEKKARPAQCRDIAILLRARTRLKDFEEALRRRGIPFLVTGGIGFFAQQEIFDLTNLLRVLTDSRQDIALAGVLRSPLLGLSDDQLLYIAADTKTERDRWTLWEKLRFHADHADLIPAELAPSVIRHAHHLLAAWAEVAERVPIPHLLRRVLDDTGLCGVIAGDLAETQIVTNIEKFIEIARKFEQQGFVGLSDFAAYLDELATAAEREGEAQIHAEGMNVVQLMTIHAAKGLEFPMVFVPEIDRPFNYGYGESVYLDGLAASQPPEIVAGVNGLNPEKNYAPEATFLRTRLLRLNEEKTDAEMKRLFYVACTRARDFLILSGTKRAKPAANSWLAWLTQILPIDEALAQQQPALTAQNLSIPILTAAAPETQADSSGAADALPHLADAAADPGLLRLLQSNLRPAARVEEIFHPKPSTLHVLFECPRRYYYQEILRVDALLPQPDRSARDADESDELEDDTFGMRRGTIIHKLFEERLFDDLLPENERIRRIETTLADFGVERHSDEWARLEPILARTAAHYTACGLKDLLTRSPEAHREYPFLLKLGNAEFSGIMDVLFRDPADGVWTILDYKTNQVAAGEVDAEIRRHGYAAQMTLYACAVSRLLRAETIRGMLFFTFPNVRYERFDFSLAALTAFEAQFNAALRRLSGDAPACADDASACAECPYARAGICSRQRAF